MCPKSSNNGPYSGTWKGISCCVLKYTNINENLKKSFEKELSKVLGLRHNRLLIVHGVCWVSKSEIWIVTEKFKYSLRDYVLKIKEKSLKFSEKDKNDYVLEKLSILRDIADSMTFFESFSENKTTQNTESLLLFTDISHSNIFIDSENRAKLTGFTLPDSQHTPSATPLYSFGAIMLELCSLKLYSDGEISGNSSKKLCKNDFLKETDEKIKDLGDLCFKNSSNFKEIILKINEIKTLQSQTIKIKCKRNQHDLTIKYTERHKSHECNQIITGKCSKEGHSVPMKCHMTTPDTCDVCDFYPIKDEVLLKQNENLNLITIEEGSLEFKKVLGEVEKTMPKAKIKKVVRIHNKKLRQKYTCERDTMENKTEKLLFHGTWKTPPKLIYDGQEGFDMRFSEKGYWGQAVLFCFKE